MDTVSLHGSFKKKVSAMCRSPENELKLRIKN